MTQTSVETAPAETLTRAVKGTRRRRLSPGDRRNEILDATARVIVEEGVSAVSMERIGRESGSSKPLVYAYFDNRQNLLTSLLVREYPAFQGELVAEHPGLTFADIIRQTTMEFIDRYVAKGVLIQRLLAEPAVAEDTLRRQRVGRDITARYFGNKMHVEYGVPRDQARVAAELLMGVTNAAARMMSQGDVDHDHLIDTTVAIIVGAAEGLGRRA